MNRLLWCLGGLLLLPSSVLAHRASDSFLALTATGATLRGHWDVALDDLGYALALDPESAALTWGALRAQEGRIGGILQQGLRFQSQGGACQLTSEALALVDLSDGTHARVAFRAACPDARNLRVHASLLAEVDRDHRTLLCLGSGEQAATHVLSAAQPSLALPRTSDASAARTLFAQLGRGWVHIFEGTDHIAFLLVLLLPAVLVRRAESHATGSRARVLALDIARVVTAFTLAHSLTLSLAGLGLVRVSAAVIEPAIAASVALAALGNLWPRHAPQGTLLAFALGLLHGFGFSSALADAGVSGGALLAALLGFNLGVELGQFAIVALFVPLALWAGRARLCRDHALSWGSSAVLALALFWVFERLQAG